MPYRVIPRYFRDRVGRRGLVLLLFGLAWAIQGSAYFILGPLGSGQFMHDRLPLWVQGSLWITTGGLGMVAAVVHKGRSDTFGFMAVTAMPMWLGISYLLGAVTYGWDKDSRWVLGLLGFSIYGIVALALSVVAAWPETGRECNCNEQ